MVTRGRWAGSCPVPRGCRVGRGGAEGEATRPLFAHLLLSGLQYGLTGPLLPPPPFPLLFNVFLSAELSVSAPWPPSRLPLKALSPAAARRGHLSRAFSQAGWEGSETFGALRLARPLPPSAAATPDSRELPVLPSSAPSPHYPQVPPSFHDFPGEVGGERGQGAE